MKNISSELVNIELTRSTTHRENESLTGRNGHRRKFEVNLTAILAIKGVTASPVVNLTSEIHLTIEFYGFLTIQKELKEHRFIETHFDIVRVPESDSRIETKTKSVLLLGTTSSWVSRKIVVNAGFNDHRGDFDRGKVAGVRRTEILLIINISTTITGRSSPPNFLLTNSSGGVTKTKFICEVCPIPEKLESWSNILQLSVIKIDIANRSIALVRRTDQEVIGRNSDVARAAGIIQITNLRCLSVI